MDILSWHYNNWLRSYNERPNHPFQTIEPIIDAIRGIFNRYGIDKLIFNTESAVQEGYIHGHELPKRWEIDASNNVVYFANHILGKEDRTDYYEQIQVYKTLAHKISPLIKVEELTQGIFSQKRIYGFKITKLDDTSVYLLWAEPDIANQHYGGKIVNFSSEYSLGEAERIIDELIQEDWQSAVGFNKDQHFIIEFDKWITGTNRAKMLSRLFEEFPEDIHALWHGDKIEGFIITRLGANAIHIGPCVATTDAGSALLSDALDRCPAEAVFIDIPLDNADAVRVAESGTLRIQRYFMRMYRGERVNDNIKALWAGSGPEKG